MRPMYEIVEMIRAHYANDDDKFNNYAKTIIDYYEKEADTPTAKACWVLIYIHFPICSKAYKTNEFL